MLSASVTGLGAISCCGVGPEALARSAYEGMSAIPSSADGEGLGRIPEGELATLPARLSEERHRECLRGLLEGLPGSKAALLTLFTICQAMERAGWRELKPTDGLVLATTTGQIALWDTALARYLQGRSDPALFGKNLRHQPLGSLLSVVSARLGFQGPSTLLASACAASTQAVALGALWLATGRARRVLVGGTEVLCELTVQGFRSLQLLSPRAATPFDLGRRGINLSEGSAFLCLERDGGEARTLARITGAGMSTDAYHMTSPHPEGEGSHRAMLAALRSAGLEPPDIGWIHAHGTGSRHNDAAEGTAITRLFGDPARAPFTSSTKGLHGHALGASGALETVLCVQALRAGRVLPTHGLTDPDPAIPLRHPPRVIDEEIPHLLKSTLGFGGTNAALVISRAPKSGVA